MTCTSPAQRTESSSKQAAIGRDDFTAGVKQRSKILQAASGRGQESLAITDTRMMSLQDNQAASSPAWPRSQVLMFQKGERRFSLADQKQPGFFRHRIK